MQTEKHSIDEILAKNQTAFFIPPFQRPYAWGRTEIERYFSDCLRIIRSERDAEQRDKLQHFFGTLVLKEEKKGFCSRSVVVDGQQRLTTTLIFLIALRDSTDDEAARNYITTNYLTNSQSDFQDKIKLKQVSKDWDSYRALINGTESEPSVIRNAYEIFSQLIARNPGITPQDYITALQRLNVAVIFLDERPFMGEDPQIIFETLNSLGKPLTLSDLVRNYVLLNMKSDEQSSVYEKTWYPKIEERLGESASAFFRDFLQYKAARPIKAVSDGNTKEIYAEFKSFVEDNYRTHDEFIADIVPYADLYRKIITEEYTDALLADKKKDAEAKELLRNIFHDIKSEAFKPFVMGLLRFNGGAETTRLPDDALIGILTAIRTYLIRRRICKLSQAENKEVVRLCGKIGDLASGEADMTELLCGSFYKMRLPNDGEIRQVLEGANFYGDYKKYAKFVLGKIEENNTKIAIGFRNPKITIEHIMPQTLSDGWRKELGERCDEIHKSYIHNIGNLILTEFNSEIGNRPFSEKKERLKESSMNYRLEITENEKWDEEAILRHRERMIRCFLETFPIPAGRRDAQNWNEKMREKEEFSPMDDDAGDIAEGNKPGEIEIGGERHKAASWQDVFLKFLRHVKEREPSALPILLAEQAGLFGREDTLTTFDALAEKIRQDEKYGRFYKTLDGKFAAKTENPAPGTIFVHINASASCFMSRIAAVMDRIGKPSEFVTIHLK